MRQNLDLMITNNHRCEYHSIFRNFKIHWIFLINSLSIWILTIATFHIYKFPPDTFYYVTQLPFFYWIGMGINCFIFILLLDQFMLTSSKKGALYSFFMLILILYIFGIPSISYTYPRIIDVHGVVKFLDAMVNGGGLIHTGNYQGIYYLNSYPLLAIFSCMICLILEISMVIFAKYYPLYLIFILSVLLYATCKRIKKEYALFAPVAYISSTFVQEYNLAPQAHALVLTAVFVFFILYIFVSGNNVIGIRALIILSWIAIVLTHPSTPIYHLICLCVCAIFFVYTGFSYKPLFKVKFELREEYQRALKIIIGLLVLFMVIYVAVIIYRSNFMLKNIVVTSQIIANNMFHGTGDFVIADLLATAPSFHYRVLNMLRWVNIIGVSFLGLLSVAYLILIRKRDSVTFILSGLFFGYVSISLIFILLGHYYGSSRSFIFLLIPFSILATLVFEKDFDLKSVFPKFLKVLKFSFILFVIISLLILPITRYGSDPYNFVSESCYAGKMFTSKHILDEPVIDRYNVIDIRLWGGEFLAFTTYWYNLLEVKQERGKEYMYYFDSPQYIKIYDSEQYKLYQNPKKT